MNDRVPWQDWRQKCEKEGVCNHEIYGRSLGFCIERPLFSGKQKKSYIN